MEQHKESQGYSAVSTSSGPTGGLTSQAASGNTAAPTEVDASFGPEVTRVSMLSMQVCVPEYYTDAQAETFANQASPTGSDTLRWAMRHNGDESLAGASERVKCEKRCGCVHIMLDC